MSVNHHLLAKTTTDSILANFKSGKWKCVNETGIDFYRVGCDSTFPSPDAAFYDDAKKLLVSFEFKPPTETKRGILTGLGQSISYLKNSNLSYLIVPKKLEDYEIGSFMTDLFENQIEDNLPVGLIIYDNDSPVDVLMTHNVIALKKIQEFKAIAPGRFWAKYQDLPIALYHLILHCYYLKKTGQISGDAFAYCWETYLVPPSVFQNLEAVEVIDLQGFPIKTPAGRKNITFYEKKLAAAKELSGVDQVNEIERLIRDADTTFVGDNNYNSTKKNFVTFIKHLGSIDSTGNLTEQGFNLYHLGITNGPNSKLFRDYFLKEVLMTGHHLDLIFDIDNLCNKYRGARDFNEIKEIMLNEYEEKGMIKKNPRRMAGDSSSVEFLKYELILWRSMGLITKTGGKPEISFNWKKITEVCSLPDL